MSELFKLAAETQLHKRLKKFFPIDENTAIAQCLTTCSDYQIFINEMSALGEIYRPDHWSCDRFPAGTSMHPVSGVRSSDAVRFCDWLSQRSQSLGYKYRLPFPHEIQLAPLELDDLGYWSFQHDGSYTVSDFNRTTIERYRKIVFSHLSVSDLHKFFPTLLKSLSAIFGHSDINACQLSLDFPRHKNIQDLLLCLDMGNIGGVALEVLQVASTSLLHFFWQYEKLYKTYSAARYNVRKRYWENRLKEHTKRERDKRFNRVEAFLRDLEKEPQYVLLPHLTKELIKTKISTVVSSRNHIWEYEKKLLIAETLLDDLFASDESRITSLSRLSDLLHQFFSDLENVVIDIEKRAYTNSLTQPANSLLLVSIVLSLLSTFCQTPDGAENFNHVLKREMTLNKTVKDFSKGSNKAVLCYVFMKIIELRRQDTIPAWEGIRLVREIVEE